MPQLRPLPRSLAPLSDESLVGFLLRLAHHNNVSPGTIVNRTGMSAHRTALIEHIPLSQQYLQTPEQAAEFSRTTRLRPDEVPNFFLAPFGSRFDNRHQSVLH
ncbi:TniQ family protein [Streptomyces sp. NPDC000609]|uniref:TniQ family protein n=1 Tax=Streptomyces sp. NPDC000609 TaxID=3160957 RepID=UPI003393BD9D